MIKKLRKFFKFFKWVCWIKKDREGTTSRVCLLKRIGCFNVNYVGEFLIIAPQHILTSLIGCRLFTLIAINSKCNTNNVPKFGGDTSPWTEAFSLLTRISFDNRHLSSCCSTRQSCPSHSDGRWVNYKCACCSSFSTQKLLNLHERGQMWALEKKKKKGQPPTDRLCPLHQEEGSA